MAPPADPSHAALRERLLDRLKPFAAGRPRSDRKAGLHAFGPQLFSYCAFTTERMTQVCLPHPSIGMVLSGSKEVWLADTGKRFSPGEVFVFPGGVAIDVVNIPDERLGLYESLLVEVRVVPDLVKAMHRTDSRPVTGFDIGVRLTGDLVDALGHAATALADSEHARALADHRLAEVLMLLVDEPAARPLFGSTLADRVRWIIREDPAFAWTAGEVAGRLGIGASTLRRSLAKSGHSLRRILTDTRMRVAGDLLAGGTQTVTQAAQASGYASRSHFARRFRAAHGMVPSRSRTLESTRSPKSS